MTCNDGYELLGDPVVKCRSDSFWSSVPLCLPFGKYLLRKSSFRLMNAETVLIDCSYNQRSFIVASTLSLYVLVLRYR